MNKVTEHNARFVRCHARLLCLLCAVQLEVFATGRSVVQGSPSDCVIVCDLETWTLVHKIEHPDVIKASRDQVKITWPLIWCRVPFRVNDQVLSLILLPSSVAFWPQDWPVLCLLSLLHIFTLTTAPTGRPNLRSRLHFSHSRVGDTDYSKVNVHNIPASPGIVQQIMPQLTYISLYRQLKSLRQQLRYCSFAALWNLQPVGPPWGSSPHWGSWPDLVFFNNMLNVNCNIQACW